MPELPDVQVFKQYLDATSLHKQIEEVKVRSQQMLRGVDARQLAKRLQGRAFEGTERHGKYLFVELDADVLRRTFDCLKEVLRVAIEHRARPEQFPDDYLTQYRHTDHPCPRCGGPIERIEVAGRAGHFCPRCQEGSGSP